MLNRFLSGFTLLVVLTTGSAATLFAQEIRAIDDNDTVVVRGNVYPLARPEHDVGATDPGLPMERMILTLKLSPDRQEELEKLLAEQQDPAFPRFPPLAYSG